MNKKIIIAIIIIVICVILAFLLINKSDKQKAIGIYHCNNWKNKEEVNLELNEDMTCKYPEGRYNCTWTISDKIITINLVTYVLKTKDEAIIRYYTTEEECNEALEKESVSLKIYYEPYCDKFENRNEAKIIKEGILLYNKIFTKID